MSRLIQDPTRLTSFDKPAEIHDGDAIADLSHEVDVVTNQEDRQIES